MGGGSSGSGDRSWDPCGDSRVMREWWVDMIGNKSGREDTRVFVEGNKYGGLWSAGGLWSYYRVIEYLDAGFKEKQVWKALFQYFYHLLYLSLSPELVTTLEKYSQQCFQYGGDLRWRNFQQKTKEVLTLFCWAIHLLTRNRDVMTATKYFY